MINLVKRGSDSKSKVEEVDNQIWMTSSSNSLEVVAEAVADSILEEDMAATGNSNSLNTKTSSSTQT